MRMAEYIEREAFLSDTTQRYCINCDSYNGVRCRACWVNDMQGEVDDFPAAEVAPVVHGRWVKNEKASEKHVEAIYVCSACQNCEAWGETEKTNYCPNCGAHMKDGE